MKTDLVFLKGKEEKKSLKAPVEESRWVKCYWSEWAFPVGVGSELLMVTEW